MSLLVSSVERKDDSSVSLWNRAMYGRIVFGASSVLFGVIALMWHDADTWEILQTLWKLPFGTFVGVCVAVAQIAGGVGVQHPRTRRVASVLLCIVYLVFSFACIPATVAATNTFDKYGGNLFQQISLLCGAVALYAATDANGAKAVVFGRAVRLGLGVCAISFALSQILYLRLTADLVPQWVPPSQMFWAILTTLAFALAAISMLVNYHARLAIQLMALMLGLFAVLVWTPRLVGHPEVHQNWSEFGLTLLVAGAAWVVVDSNSF